MVEMSHTTKENCDPLRQHTAKMDHVNRSSGSKRNRSSFEQLDTNASPPLTSKQRKLETLQVSNELLRDENAQLKRSTKHLEGVQLQLHSQIKSQQQRICHLEEDVARMYRYQKKELIRTQNQYTDQFQPLQVQVEKSSISTETFSIQQLASNSVALQQALSACTQTWIETQHKVETHSVMENLILAVERNCTMEHQHRLQEERDAIHQNLCETQKDCEDFLMQQAINWQEVSYLHETEKKALNEHIRKLNSQIDAMEMERSQAINELESKLKATNETILFHQTQWTQSNERVKALTQSLNEMKATKPKMDLAQSHNALLEKEEQLKTASAAVGHLHLENESLKRKLEDTVTQKESLQTQLTLLSKQRVEIAHTDTSHLIPSNELARLIAEKVELEKFVGRYVHMAESKIVSNDQK